MKTRWYFILAGAAVAGFAAWYQDFERHDAARRAAVAARIAAERAAEVERLRGERDAQAAEALRQARARAEERAKRALAAAEAQARREAWQSRLAALREENAALRTSRDRLSREVEDCESRLATQAADAIAVAAEDEFLRDYIREANASVARLEAVAARAATYRFATVTTPTARPSH